MQRKDLLRPFSDLTRPTSSSAVDASYAGSSDAGVCSETGIEHVTVQSSSISMELYAEVTPSSSLKPTTRSASGHSGTVSDSSGSSSSVGGEDRGSGSSGGSSRTCGGDGAGVMLRRAVSHASVFASVVAKQAARRAFRQQGRAMTAPDVIAQLGAAFQQLHPDQVLEEDDDDVDCCL